MPPRRKRTKTDTTDTKASGSHTKLVKVKTECMETESHEVTDNKDDLKESILYSMLATKEHTTDTAANCRFDFEKVKVKSEHIVSEVNIIKIEIEKEDSETESDEEIIETDEESFDEECPTREFNWTTNPDSMKSLEFTKRPMRVQLPENPYEAFGAMFTEYEFLELMVRETNAVARRHVTSWTDVTIEEMLVFIGLLIHTGTIRINRISDYWNEHWLFNLTCFSKYMTLERYVNLLEYISFTSEKANKKEIKVELVQPLIDHFNETMKRLVHPNAELLVQEPFPVSETRRGARLHSLCDDNGLTLKFILTPETHSKHFEKVVFDLLEGHLDCGHSVYIKDHFLSYDLATKLLERTTYSTGPLKEHASLSPMMISLPNTPYNFFADSIHIGRWQDLIYITTEHKDELMEVVIPRTGKVTMKPKVVIKYKNAISKINKSDISDTRKKEKSSLESFTAYYPHQRKDMRWDEKVFVHILNQWMINAYLLTPAEPFKTYYDFRLNILENLLPGEQKIRTESLRIPHTLTKIENVKIRHRNEGGKMVMRREVVRKDCKGCRALSRRGTTCFECKECEGSPGYCVGCFETAHK